MNNVRYVIFDLDGTLIDSFDTIVDNCRTVLIHLCGNASCFEFSMYRGMCLETLFRQCAEYGNVEYPVFKRAFDEAYANNFLNKTSVFQPALSMLEEYKHNGLSIIVLTNKQQVIAEKICNTLLAGKIDCIIGRNADYLIKNKENIHKRLAEFNIDVKHCVMYVGDSVDDAECAEHLRVPFQRISILDYK